MPSPRNDAALWTSISRRPTPFEKSGREYQVIVEGQQRSDGTWAGRIVFQDGLQSVRTGQETSQPNRAALEYWATGLEKVYLDGALSRARA